MDLTAGISACSAVANDKCDYSITNNIVAATSFAGYVAYGHDCGIYSSVFKNNLAHSINGNGAVIFPDPRSSRQQNCMEASYFNAYKNREAGAISIFPTPNITYSNMIFVDNGIGPSPLVGIEGDNLWSKMSNIAIYGETLARDCPSQDLCLAKNDDPSCVDRTGFMLPQFVNGGKLAMPTLSGDLPMHRSDRPASFGGNIIASEMTFKNFFSSKTWCGSRQRLFGLNNFAPDYQPKALIEDSRFENIHEDALAYF